MATKLAQRKKGISEGQLPNFMNSSPKQKFNLWDKQTVLTYTTLKIFPDLIPTMSNDSNMVDFFFYSMTCQTENMQPIDVEKLIEEADFEGFSSKYILSKSNINYQVVIEKLQNDIYFGNIIRSKDATEYYKIDTQTIAVKDIEDAKRIGERRKDLGNFVFVSRKKDNGNELVFLTEVGFQIPGMRKITDFFERCFSPYKFYYKPLKNIRMGILEKITKKKLKSIKIRFRKNPEIPSQYEQVEELLKRVGVKENYTLEIDATMKITKNTDRTKIFDVDHYFNNLFGNPLQRAIDDGIDLPAFLTNLEVEIIDDETQQKETINIIKKYDKVSISIDKMEISDENKIKEWLSQKLAEKLGIEQGD
jgi:hypothetical protein